MVSHSDQLVNYTDEDDVEGSEEEEDDDEFVLPGGLFTYFRQRSRPAVEPSGAGRPVEIHAEAEQKLMDNLMVSGRYGHGFNRVEVRRLVGEFVANEHIKTRWVDGLPGQEWMKKFLKRHEELRLRKLDTPRRKATSPPDPYVVYDFYDDLDLVYDRESLLSQGQGHRVYNVGLLEFPPGPAAAGKSTQCRPCDARNAARDHGVASSVVVGVRADGVRLTPLVAFRGRCLVPSTRTGGGLGCHATTSRRWGDSNPLPHWFERVFVPSLPDRDSGGQDRRSAVLFLDGSWPALDMRTLVLAKRAGVVVVRLPPHAVPRLQPLSDPAFDVLASAWDAQRGICVRTNLATAQRVFCKVLGFVWNRHLDGSSISAAFRRTGLYPPDRLQFPTTAFSQPILRRYLEFCRSEDTDHARGILRNARSRHAVSTSTEDPPKRTNRETTVRRKRRKTDPSIKSAPQVVDLLD